VGLRCPSIKIMKGEKLLIFRDNQVMIVFLAEKITKFAVLVILKHLIMNYWLTID